MRSTTSGASPSDTSSTGRRGAGDVGPHHGEHLLLAPRQRARVLAEPVAEHGEARRAATSRAAASAPPVRLHGQVLPHRQRGEDAAALGDVADAELGALARPQGRDVVVVQQHHPRHGLQQPRRHPQQGRLAGAVGSEQRDDGAVGYHEVDGTQHDRVAVPAGDLLQLEHPGESPLVRIRAVRPGAYPGRRWPDGPGGRPRRRRRPNVVQRFSGQDDRATWPTGRAGAGTGATGSPGRRGRQWLLPRWRPPGGRRRRDRRSRGRSPTGRRGRALPARRRRDRGRAGGAPGSVGCGCAATGVVVDGPHRFADAVEETVVPDRPRRRRRVGQIERRLGHARVRRQRRRHSLEVALGDEEVRRPAPRSAAATGGQGRRHPAAVLHGDGVVGDRALVDGDAAAGRVAIEQSRRVVAGQPARPGAERPHGDPRDVVHRVADVGELHVDEAGDAGPPRRRSCPGRCRPAPGTSWPPTPAGGRRGRHRRRRAGGRGRARRCRPGAATGRGRSGRGPRRPAAPPGCRGRGCRRRVGAARRPRR